MYLGSLHTCQATIIGFGFGRFFDIEFNVLLTLSSRLWLASGRVGTAGMIGPTEGPVPLCYVIPTRYIPGKAGKVR